MENKKFKYNNKKINIIAVAIAVAIIGGLAHYANQSSCVTVESNYSVQGRDLSSVSYIKPEFEETLEEENVEYKDILIQKTPENKTYAAYEIEIMGYKEIDYAQAVSFILSKAESSDYGIDNIKLNGLSVKEHILNLCKAAEMENINPHVIIAQQVLETGVYGFVNSMVKPTDNNYCGLGALDGGNSANEFSSNFEGQLAQAQHLKGYASQEPLNAEEADVRFSFINRGVAPTIDGLAGTWASDLNYGDSIARIYNELLNHQTNEEILKEYADKIF